MFGTKRWWQADLETESRSIGHALGQVITGQMPADFLDDVMGVAMEKIKPAFAAAVEDGKEKKAEKILWKGIEYPAEMACKMTNISPAPAWHESRALKDLVLASCRAG